MMHKENDTKTSGSFVAASKKCSELDLHQMAALLQHILSCLDSTLCTLLCIFVHFLCIDFLKSFILLCQIIFSFFVFPSSSLFQWHSISQVSLLSTVLARALALLLGGFQKAATPLECKWLLKLSHFAILGDLLLTRPHSSNLELVRQTRGH